MNQVENIEWVKSERDDTGCYIMPPIGNEQCLITTAWGTVEVADVISEEGVALWFDDYDFCEVLAWALLPKGFKNETE